MSKIKVNELSYNFVSAKCNMCDRWHTYMKNQVPIYANNNEEVVICNECFTKTNGLDTRV